MSFDKYRTAVITLSDRGAAGLRTDESGPEIRRILTQTGKYEVVCELLLPDGRERLEEELKRICDEGSANLILTTGGTGFSERDLTPEATLAVAEREAPGISEYLRMKSMEITAKAMLSRAVSVIRKKTLIINLPGSPKAVRESMEFLLPTLDHGMDILLGKDGECGSRAAKDFSFTDAEAKRWLDEDEAAKEGFCSERWKSDFVVEALREMRVGACIDINGESYRLTKVGKRCYEDCPLRDRLGKSCPLAAGVAFGERIEK